MYYLLAYNRGLFEGFDYYISFILFKKPFKIYEQCFLSHITISLKKMYLSTNIRNVIATEKQISVFWRPENWSNLSL